MSERNNHTSIWAKLFGGLFYLTFCFVTLAAGSATGWIGKSAVLAGIIKTKLHIPQADPFEGKDSLTLLVLGCDEDWYFGGKQLIRHKAQSDMMLVAKLDFKNNRITGLSIPRDTLCQVAGYRDQKINAYHLLGGNNLSKEAVETLLPDVHIDRVMALNFDAFKEMVDTVGGVEVYVPKNMNYDDNRGHLHIHLKTGKQKLDGEAAEGFVRFRHTDDDFHRTDRQRDFMLAFKDSVIHHWTLLPQVSDKAEAVMGHALTPDEIASIATFASKVGSDNIQMGLLPTLDAGNFNLQVDERQLPIILHKYHLTPDDATVDPSRVSYRS